MSLPESISTTSPRPSAGRAGRRPSTRCWGPPRHHCGNGNPRGEHRGPVDHCPGRAGVATCSRPQTTRMTRDPERRSLVADWSKGAVTSGIVEAIGSELAGLTGGRAPGEASAIPAGDRRSSEWTRRCRSESQSAPRTPPWAPRVNGSGSSCASRSAFAGGASQAKV